MQLSDLKPAFLAAVPIMLGYVSIGVPCGILSASVGLSQWQVLLLCVLFYSGAGQFMIPNMWLAASPVASIIASVSFVNTRQILYGAALSPWCEGASKRLSCLFAATVTDESFGVNTQRFEEGGWSVGRATLVNLCSQSSWTISCVLGVCLGDMLGVPLAIAAFAMTSIFICLLVTQKGSVPNIVAAAGAIAGVVGFKLAGLGGASIFLGAVVGVVLALLLTNEGGEGEGGEEVTS